MPDQPPPTSAALRSVIALPVGNLALRKVALPVVEAIKLLFPAKRIGVIIPINGKAESLKQACDFHMKMKEKQKR
jgi:hypothetical protein